MSEMSSLRLLIVNGDSTRVLTEWGVLPGVSIPKDQRMAPLVISELHRLYGCEALCLFLTDDRAHFVMECLSAGSALEWRSIAELDSSLQPVVREALMKDGPFSKPGWTRELRAFTGFTGTFEQHNASPYFSLMRFRDSGRDLWFKAVGPSNLREFPVTKALAQRCPGFVPRVLAIKPKWNAWIMQHQEGRLLEDEVTLEAWKRTVEALADLQVELAGEDRYLLDIGCTDCRLEALAAQAEPFFESMAELMERQPKTPPERLNRRELQSLGRQIVELCERFASLRLANSIIHGDIGPHNVVLSRRGPIFIDWAEAYLGQPFCSFERMMAHLRKDYPDHMGWAGALQEAYANRWMRKHTRAAVFEGLALARILMVYVLAVRASSPGSEEHDKWTRSMVRRMKRELETLSLQEVA